MSTTTNSISAKATSLTINKSLSTENIQRYDIHAYCDGPIVSEYISQRCSELHTQKNTDDEKNKQHILCTNLNEFTS